MSFSSSDAESLEFDADKLSSSNEYDASMFSPGATLDSEIKARIACSVKTMLGAIGSENLDVQGTERTPIRVAEMFDELLVGYSMDPDELLNGALFDVEYDEMVVVKSIDFYSLCEHHLLPFHGQAHVGYLPAKQVVGLSKIPRIVNMFARRLQVQERMTQQIAQFLDDLISPRGVGVIVEGYHMCTVMRGVSKPNVVMITSAVLGSFRDNPATRDEFVGHVRASGL